MSIDAIISTLSIAGTLIGTFAGIVFSNKLTIYRIEQLEKKVEKHNEARSKDKSVDVQIYLETNPRVLKKRIILIR